MTIALRDVTYRYAGADRDAVHGVTIDIPSDQLTFITGRLGAGCSTLLQIMAGLVPRLSGGSLVGRVSVLAQDPGHEEGASALRGQVALLLPSPWTQLSGMTFTVRDEVAFGPANLAWPIERIWQSADRMMAMFGIEHLAARDPTTLSGGELQRTVLAGLLAMEPRVLLLDEPTQELDPASAAQVFEVLSRQKGLTCVVATADQDLVVQHADYVFAMHEGRILEHGDGFAPLRARAVVDAGASSTIGSLFRGADVDEVPLTVDEATDRLSG